MKWAVFIKSWRTGNVLALCSNSQKLRAQSQMEERNILLAKTFGRAGQQASHHCGHSHSLSRWL